MPLRDRRDDPGASRSSIPANAGLYSLRAALLMKICPVIPGRAPREPGIHNHDREYGFPDAQLRIIRATLASGAR
jgi:hypothetical protein